MNERNRKKFEKLLLDLISAQDDITHLNEHCAPTKQIRAAIEKREIIKDRIMREYDFLASIADRPRSR